MNREAFERARSVLLILTGCTEAEAQRAADRSWEINSDRDLDAMSWLVSMNLCVSEAIIRRKYPRRSSLRALRGGK